MRDSMQVWQRFINLPGATVGSVVGIASENAISGLIKIVRRHTPSHILELGAGIGTLTYSILKTAKQAGLLSKSDFIFLTVENNDYCLQQLAKNLKEFEGSYRVIASTDSLRESGTKFDLIVVDGGGNLPGDMGVMDFADLLNHRGSVFVEGGRRYQRMKITEWYGHRDHVYM